MDNKLPRLEITIKLKAIYQPMKENYPKTSANGKEITIDDIMEIEKNNFLDDPFLYIDGMVKYNKIPMSIKIKAL